MRALEFIAQHFEKTQLIILIIGLVMAYFMFRERLSPQSQFKVREADRKDLNHLFKMKESKKATPLELPGIRLHGKSHEILGVDENASEAEVMRAYKEAIKRFHPDRIQGQAKEQIQFYQEASAKLNQAKDELLKKLKSR